MALIVRLLNVVESLNGCRTVAIQQPLNNHSTTIKLPLNKHTTIKQAL